jgi:GT2 family glycosyltransferase
LQTSIVIPVFNNLNLTRICIAAIDRHTPPGEWELVVVDNGSTDGVGEWLHQVRLQNGELRVVHNRTNLGFGAACNQGLAAAKGDVLLLNNDAVVTAQWLSRLRQPLINDPSIGITGPRTNFGLGPQLVTNVPHGIRPSEMEQLAEQMAAQNAGHGVNVDFLSGFCLLISRSVIDRLGALDARYGFGYYEDTDYCVRARLSGYRLWVCGDTYVHHFGSETMKKVVGDLDTALQANWEIFRTKWQLPADRDPWGTFTMAEIKEAWQGEPPLFIPFHNEGQSSLQAISP